MKCGVKYAKLGKKILLVSPQILYIAIPNVFIIVVLIIMTASPSSSETKLVDLFSLANPGMSSGIPGGVISPLSQTLVGVRNVFAVVYAFVLLLNCIMSYFVVSKFKKASSCLLMNMLSVLGVLPFQILFFLISASFVAAGALILLVLFGVFGALLLVGIFFLMLLAGMGQMIFGWVILVNFVISIPTVFYAFFGMYRARREGLLSPGKTMCLSILTIIPVVNIVAVVIAMVIVSKNAKKMSLPRIG